MQLNYFDSDDERTRKRHGRKGDDESESSDDSDDGDRGKRRGRRPATKQAVKGFNNAEIRRFIKSFKKFGHPHERCVPLCSLCLVPSKGVLHLYGSWGFCAI